MKEVDNICFFDKVKSFGIDSCLCEIPKNDWVDDMKLCHVPRCVLLPHRHAGRLYWGKAESIQLFDFADGSSHYRCRSAILLIIPAMCSTVIRAEVRPSQCVNKIPHKVWVAVHTDGTTLLSADMSVPYGIISRPACDCQIYIKCMNTVVYLVHF